MITIISGTNRRGSCSSRMAHYYAELLKEQGQSSRIIEMVKW